MPVLKALVPFACGIVLAAYVVLPAWFIVAALAGCGAAALLLHRSRYLIVFLLAAGYGATLLQPTRLTIPLDRTTLFELRITEPATETGAFRHASGIVTAWRDPLSGRWYGARSLVRLHGDSLLALEAGERLCCRMRIRSIAGGSASYRRLMRRRGYVGSGWLTERNLLEREAPRWQNLHHFASKVLAERLSPYRAAMVDSGATDPDSGRAAAAATAVSARTTAETTVTAGTTASAATAAIAETATTVETATTAGMAVETAPAAALGAIPESVTRTASATALSAEPSAAKAVSEFPASGKSRSDAAAVVRAMTVGDRRALTPALREAYARSGMAHLLAVSGLHTGIVFLFVHLLFGVLALRHGGHRLRDLLVIAVVWCYVAAAGFPPGAVRAAVMCSILQLALATSSTYRALNAWAAAALLLLALRPAWLGDISFQLSFVAVAAILAWGIPLARRCRTGRWYVDRLLQALLVGLSASVATAPLISHTFGIVPVAGILLNPLVVLSGTLVVAGGLLLLLLLPLGGLLAPLVLGAAEGQNRLAEAIAGLDGGTLDGSLSTAATAAIYLGFVAATLLVWSVEPKKSVHLPV